MNPVDAIARFGRTTGEYWADDNARFERTNPSVLRRAGRSLSPVTGIGSALGQYHAGLRDGDLVQAATGAVSSIPLFGGYTTIANPNVVSKTRQLLVPNVRQLADRAAGQTGFDVLNDELAVPSPPPGPRAVPVQFQSAPNAPTTMKSTPGRPIQFASPRSMRDAVRR